MPQTLCFIAVKSHRHPHHQHSTFPPPPHHPSARGRREKPANKCHNEQPKANSNNSTELVLWPTKTKLAFLYPSSRATLRLMIDLCRPGELHAGCAEDRGWDRTILMTSALV